MARRRYVRYTEKFTDLARKMPERVDEFGRGVVTQMTAEIVASFGSGPSGRTYQRRGISHIASAPGFPPNIDTGALRASINWEALGNLTYMIQDGVEYGAYLEFGTKKLAPRPFMSPVFEEWSRQKFVDAARRSGLFDV